jgi:hypothetical protein
MKKNIDSSIFPGYWCQIPLYFVNFCTNRSVLFSIELILNNA